MNELIDALVTALNSGDLDGKFGRAKRVIAEDCIEIEFDGDEYYLDVVPS